MVIGGNEFMGTMEIGSDAEFYSNIGLKLAEIVLIAPSVTLSFYEYVPSPLLSIY